MANDCHRWGDIKDQTAICADTASDAFAEVRIYNSMVGGPNEVRMNLQVNGITVTVLAIQFGGDIPDDYYIYVPEGYYAVPDSVTVKERATAVIKIYQDGMS